MNGCYSQPAYSLRRKLCAFSSLELGNVRHWAGARVPQTSSHRSFIWTTKYRHRFAKNRLQPSPSVSSIFLTYSRSPLCWGLHLGNCMISKRLRRPNLSNEEVMGATKVKKKVIITKQHVISILPSTSRPSTAGQLTHWLQGRSRLCCTSLTRTVLARRARAPPAAWRRVKRKGRPGQGASK